MYMYIYIYMGVSVCLCVYVSVCVCYIYIFILFQQLMIKICFGLCLGNIQIVLRMYICKQT